MRVSSFAMFQIPGMRLAGITLIIKEDCAGDMVQLLV